jgi:hypothetical protein
MSFTIRTWRWLAPVALVGVVGLAACGDDDASVSTRTADVGAAAGSDQHLENQAAEIAVRSAAAGSDRHLENLAAEIGERSSAESGVNVWTAGDRAASERLTAEAEQYRESQASPEEYVPGTRHMPMR